MTKNNNVPQIRFKGFTDTWEQRKLGDMMNVTSVKRIHQSDWTSSGVRFLRARDIVAAYKNEEPSDYLYISEEKYNEYSSLSGKVKIGDLLVTGVGTIGVPMLINSEKPLYFKDGNIIWFQNENKINGDFFYYSFIGNSIQNFIQESAGTGTVGTYTIDSGKKTPVALPKDITEQQQIGTYFRNLDNLITLHQRKCETLKKLKKSMLQKMFPKNGKSVPEIRFAGFTDAWEQRKLGEVFEQTTNFVNLDEGKMELWSLTVEDGLTPKSERYNREFLVKKDTNFKEVRPGDIVYNPMNMTLGAVGYNGMAKSIAVSGYYTTMVANAGYDSYYVNTWLKSPYAISLYKTFATGSLKEKQRVQFPTLSIIPTVFPENEEQKKIGLFFERLDNLITLHQRKLETLKKLKKSMLQKMFI